MAHKFVGISTYNYVFNNPVRFTDPTGMQPNEGCDIGGDCGGALSSKFWSKTGGGDPPVGTKDNPASLPTATATASYDRSKFTRVNGKLVENSKLFKGAQSSGDSGLGSDILSQNGFSEGAAILYMKFLIQNNEYSDAALVGSLWPAAIVGGIQAAPLLYSGGIAGYNGASAAYFEGSLALTKMTSSAVGGIGAFYFGIGTALRGNKFYKLHPRITNVSLRGYGHGQFDIGHRATTFLRTDILSKGSVGVRNWNTIYYNYSAGGKNFSIGVNPWKRTIFHEGPGIFK